MSGKDAHPQQCRAALLAHMPICFRDRVEKALLLEQVSREVMMLTGRSEVSAGDPVFLSLITPQIEAELEGFRYRERVYIDCLEPIFGKGAVTWWLMLVLEAGYVKQAKGYLDMLLSKAAATYDAHELRLFAAACETIKRCGHGYAQPDKAKALLFYAARSAMGQPVKDGKEIAEVLKKRSPVEWTAKAHNLSRILRGPILGPLKRGKRRRPAKGLIGQRK